MTWHVQYRRESVDLVARFPSPEKAIEAACKLMDAAIDVFGIGTGPLTDSIGQDQIAKIYANWVIARGPFGRSLPLAPIRRPEVVQSSK
jgi:hypothetical protein